MARANRRKTDSEISILRRVIDIVTPLSPAARQRVLTFAAQRLAEEPAPVATPQPPTAQASLPLSTNQA